MRKAQLDSRISTENGDSARFEAGSASARGRQGPLKRQRNMRKAQIPVAGPQAYPATRPAPSGRLDRTDGVWVFPRRGPAEQKAPPPSSSSEIRGKILRHMRDGGLLCRKCRQML